VSRWNGKSLSSGQLAKIYGFIDNGILCRER